MPALNRRSFACKINCSGRYSGCQRFKEGTVLLSWLGWSKECLPQEAKDELMFVVNELRHCEQPWFSGGSYLHRTVRHIALQPPVKKKDCIKLEHFDANSLSSLCTSRFRALNRLFREFREAPMSPVPPGESTKPGSVPHPRTDPNLVFFCRQVYDYRMGRIIKNPVWWELSHPARRIMSCNRTSKFFFYRIRLVRVHFSRYFKASTCEVFVINNSFRSYWS